MEYLYKIYYKNKDAYEGTYKSRINFEETLKTELFIRPLKDNIENQLYFVYNRETLDLIDRVTQNDYKLEKLNDRLPGVAEKAFILDLISSELKSTNDLEGIESDKDEIIETTRNIINEKKPDQERLISMIKSYLLLIERDALSLPIDLKDIRKIYDEITFGEIEESDEPDGKYFRTQAVYVQKKNTVSGEIIHEGVKGEKNIEGALKKLLNFLRKSEIDLLIRIAIGHYYFGYIHPFYDGNGRVNRFISSMFIRSKYNYLTSMSLARGSWIEKTYYYKAFDRTNSKINKGELNYFIDEFLRILISGQEDIIFNLTDKIEKLDRAKGTVDEEKEIIDSELKKKIIFLLTQNYYFDKNSGLSRDEIYELTREVKNKSRKIKELRDLQDDGFIKAIKERPLIYVLDRKFIEKLWFKNSTIKMRSLISMEFFILLKIIKIKIIKI